MKNNYPRSTIQDQGFTLVELLLVVAIIGILAGIMSVVLNPFAQLQRARDARRKADIAQIQAALEQYRADAGMYPPNASLQACKSALTYTNGGNTVTYLQSIPCDPRAPGYYNINGTYYYNSPSGNATYTLAACLENTNDPQGTATSPGGSGCTTKYYVVTNP